MTIYDLTEAFKRYRVPVITSLVVLIMVMLIMTFTIEDGGISWRSGVRYESGVQIAVIERGTESLTTVEATNGQLVDTALLYASMLASAEAAEWVAKQNGYSPEGLIDVSTQRNTAVIVAEVIAPTREQAIGSALSTFDWLNMKLLEPLETSGFPTPPTTVPVISFTGPAESFMDVTVSRTLADLTDDLFLSIEIPGANPLTFLPAANAGTVIRSSTIVDPLMTVELTLLGDDGSLLDTTLVAPPPAPSTVPAIPGIGVLLDEGSIRSVTTGEDTTSFNLDASRIMLVWLEGSPAESAVGPDALQPADLELALITTEPGVLQTGGRRGPILALAVLLVGFVLIVAGVVIADTWSRDRDAQATSTMPTSLAPVVSSDPTGGGDAASDEDTDVDHPEDTALESRASWKKT